MRVFRGLALVPASQGLADVWCLEDVATWGGLTEPCAYVASRVAASITRSSKPDDRHLRGVTMSIAVA